jgi:hypothetical protein
VSGPPFAPLRRAPPDSQIAAVPEHSDDPTSALSVTAEQLGRTGLCLARLGNVLPGDVLCAENRPIYAKSLYKGQDTFVHRVAQGLRLTGLVPRAAGATPGKLDELIERKGLYLGIRALGDRVRNCAMDLRLIYGSYQFYLIEQVMTYLERRLTDPHLTGPERESLLEDFGTALVKLDRALRKGPERKHELALLRDRASAEAQDAQDEADLQEVIHQIHSEKTPERAALLKAAQRYLDRTAPAATDGGEGAAPAPTGLPIDRPKLIR